MIVHARDLQEVNRRIDYKIGAFQEALKHFVVRVTTPDNPFGPHKHEGAEFWFVLEGEATVVVDGQESAVVAGDLVYLAPWTHHGLQSKTSARWICLG